MILRRLGTARTTTFGSSGLKLFTKYVGVTYYGLDEDQIPSSAMYQPLYSLRALDGIHGDLSVTASTPLPAPDWSPFSRSEPKPRATVPSFSTV